MWRFLTRRLIFFVVTLLFTSLLIFTLTNVLPGDVARTILGRNASEAQLVEVREELGLDQPLPLQYLNWVGGYLTGDWGMTFTSPRQPIREVIGRRLANTARLALLTLLIAVPLSVTLGVIAGLNEGKPLDNIISILSLSVVSLPEFVTGLFLINVVALGTGLFPPSSAVRVDTPFFEALPALWLPAVTATLVLIAYIVRLVRAGIIEELKKDYVNTAVLKGIPYPTVIVRHVLRNALIPTITVIATSTGWLVSGLVVVETVFNYPGLGRLLIFGIDNRDLPLVQAIVMVTVFVILVANVLADLAYIALNPRIELT
ncbi:MAG: ABC transporter permease [Chloroflexi bacterium]|nr:ABC transporter permease [Chloroflexota bacterium]